MSKKNAIVYPYSSYSAALLRNKDMVNQYNIIGAVAPCGLSLANQDSSVVDGGEASGILVKENFDEEIEKCDVVIVGEYPIKDNGTFEKVIYQNISNAIKKKREIVSLYDFKEKYEDMLRKLALENKSSYQSYKDWQGSEDEYKYPEEMEDIDTPILVIAGLSGECSKFDLQLSIRRAFNQNGFKVSQVSSKHYGELCDMHSFPSFMYKQKLTEEEKILEFNSFIKKIEDKEAPDIIIITVPGGILPLNKRNHERFGITSIEVGCAISPDLILLSLPYTDPSNINLEELSTLLEYRFSCKPFCYTMSNYRLNSADMNSEYKKVSYDHMNYRQVEQLVYDTSIYSAVSRGGQDEISNQAIELLKNFDYVENKAISEEYKHLKIDYIKEWLNHITNNVFKHKDNNQSDMLELDGLEQLYLQTEIIKKFNVLITKEQINSNVMYSKEAISQAIVQNSKLRSN